jgi:FkbM family methyltransferase
MAMKVRQKFPRHSSRTTSLCFACLGVLGLISLFRIGRFSTQVSLSSQPASQLLHDPNHLIYDIGLNDGTDTGFYLKTNYSVVAVDANPMMVAKASGRFLNSIMTGKLRLLNVGLVDDKRLPEGESGGPYLDFYVHKLQDDWSSFRRDWGCRDPKHPNITTEDMCQVIPVPTTSCGALVKTLGRGHFMKIDIEGYDMACIQSVALLGNAYLPTYVSVEGPSVEKVDFFSNHGYRRFKIQSMKQVLPDFYALNGISAMGKGGASGPWGEAAIDIESGRRWRSAHDVVAEMKKMTGKDGDWYDLHAAM